MMTRVAPLGLMLFVTLATGCIPDMNRDGKLVVLCVGDSNTATLGWQTRGPSWCNQLAFALPDVTVLNFGYPGLVAVPEPTGTQRVLADQLTLALAAATPDLVIFAVGLNDSAHDVATETYIEAIQGARQRVAAVGALARVALVPPALVTSARLERIQAYNAALRATLPALALFDFWSPLIDPAGAPNPLLFADALHWNAAGQTAEFAVVRGGLGVP